MSRFGLPSTWKRLPRWSGAGAQDIGGKAEKAGFVHAGEEKAKGKPYCYLQAPDKKMQRQWRQTLLRRAQRKDKRQWKQTGASEIPLRY